MKLEDLYARTEPDLDGCLLWTGALDAKGYARVGHDGANQKASRVVFQMINGPLAPGLIVRHTCDKRPCINGAHLVGGTHKDNAADRSARRRHAAHRGTFRGERLDWPAVLSIRASSEPPEVLAERYQITLGHCHRVKSGRAWKNGPV